MRGTPALMTNTLYYGDNLTVLREHIQTESVDLIYLDPPFNSNANYFDLICGLFLRGVEINLRPSVCELGSRLRIMAAILSRP